VPTDLVHVCTVDVWPSRRAHMPILRVSYLALALVQGVLVVEREPVAHGSSLADKHIVFSH